jgi:hypothetical protein
MVLRCQYFAQGDKCRTAETSHHWCNYGGGPGSLPQLRRSIESAARLERLKPETLNQLSAAALTFISLVPGQFSLVFSCAASS